MALLDIVVCHTAALGFLSELVVRRVRVARDDVPGVNQTRQETQAAKGDVDERVGRADATLDPYCKAISATESFKSCALLGPCCSGGCAGLCGEGGGLSLTSDGREENGQEAQEDITAAHVVRLVLV
jgi:hypothetical protein